MENKSIKNRNLQPFPLIITFIVSPHGVRRHQYIGTHVHYCPLFPPHNFKVAPPPKVFLSVDVFITGTTAWYLISSKDPPYPPPKMSKYTTTYPNNDNDDYALLLMIILPINPPPPPDDIIIARGQ